jgi:hypothetical protein
MIESDPTSEKFSYIMARLEYRIREVGNQFVALSTTIHELQLEYLSMRELLRASQDATSEETHSQ